LTSTNDEAMSLAAAGREEGTIVVCEKQTAGRGQQNNIWESKKGENLTMSLILRPKIAAADLFLLSKVFSLAVVRALNQYGINALIKWPNDIYVENRKIAGILIEHSFCGEKLSFSVIGLGLNIKQKNFAPMNVTPTSVILETGKAYSNDEVLLLILNNFNSLYALLENEVKAPINDGYMEKLYRKEGFFPYKKQNGEVLIAEITDVAVSGELILRDKEGKISSFLFKEVSYV
jgi:BirA family biotin operon repressor/biotin-[acetyl-CoA-carboxylase] ligase